MKILKIIVPKGEKPKKCSLCRFRNFSNCYATMKNIDKHIYELENTNPDCPIVEEEPALFCQNVLGCDKWDKDECYPETCENLNKSWMQTMKNTHQ